MKKGVVELTDDGDDVIREIEESDVFNEGVYKRLVVLEREGRSERSD